MVSSKPVPSRAALNALRGLVFTTGCSVFILSEERRRRTRIARAAFDNARKLHTVKSPSRPSILSHAWLSDSDCESLLIGKRGNPQRRKKRQRQRLTLDDYDGDFVDIREQMHRSTLKRRNGSISLDYPAAALNKQKSSRNLVDVSQNVHHGYLMHSDAAIRGLVNMTATFDRLQFSHSGRPRAVNTNSRARRHGPVEFHAGMATLTSATKPITASTFKPSPSMGSSTLDATLTGEIREFLGRKPSTLEDEAFHDAVIPLLNRLLTELDPWDLSYVDAAPRLDLALEIFEKMATLGSIEPYRKAMEAHSVSMIKYAITLGSEKLALTLNRALPFCKDIYRLLAVVLDWMMESRIVESVSRLIDAFSSSECSSMDLDGKAVYHVLARHATLYQKPSRTIDLYHMLHQSGLPRSAALGEDAEAETRELMNHVLQVDAQSNSNPEPTTNLKETVPTAKNSDEATGKQFQGMLVKLTDICAQRHSPGNFEAIVRYLVETYNMKLEGRWVYPVLMRYARLNNLDTVFSWIQFCLQNDFRIDDAYILDFYRKCHHSWGIPDEELGNFSELLKTANSKFFIPDWTRAITPSGESHQQSGILKPAEGWERFYIRTARKLATGSSSADETKAFNSMERFAKRADWLGAWTAYEKFAVGDTKFSLRCLRLAVLARVKLDDGSTENAGQLLWRCSYNRDVSEAATPLLMAKLANGRTPKIVINDALSYGIRIHEMVYNSAAQKAIASGHLSDAVHICKRAVSENGSGDALYNEFIFLNLMSAYVLQVRYTDLMTLLDNFMERRPSWSGSDNTKRALKLNMKTLAKRAAMAGGTSNRRHEMVFKTMNMALEHNFECMVFHGTPEESKTIETPNHNAVPAAPRSTIPKQSGKGAKVASSPRVVFNGRTSHRTSSVKTSEDIQTQTFTKGRVSEASTVKKEKSQESASGLGRKRIIAMN